MLYFTLALSYFSKVQVCITVIILTCALLSVLLSPSPFFFLSHFPFPFLTPFLFFFPSSSLFPFPSPSHYLPFLLTSPSPSPLFSSFLPLLFFLFLFSSFFPCQHPCVQHLRHYISIIVPNRHMVTMDHPRPMLIYRQVIRQIRLLRIWLMGAILFTCEYLLN